MQFFSIFTFFSNEAVNETKLNELYENVQIKSLIFIYK